MGIEAIGPGVILAGIVAVLIWKRTMRKTAAVFAVLAGLCLSGWVVQYAGGLTGYTIGGVGLVTGGLIIGLIIFIHEVRGHGHHIWRTPLVGFAVGVLAMTAGGAIGQAAQHAQHATVTTVHNSTSDATGG